MEKVRNLKFQTILAEVKAENKASYSGKYIGVSIMVLAAVG